MDYSNIHSIDYSESKESRYKEVKDTKDISPAGKIEFERAKSILSIVSPNTNISLYDHFVAILRKVLRFGIEDAVDTLEDISRSIKDEKRTPDTEIIEGILPDENLQKMIEQKKQFYKLSPVDERKPVIKPSERVDEEDTGGDDEEEVEAEDTEDENLMIPDLAASLPDLYHKISRFRLGGIGLSDEEVHDLNVALRELAKTYKLEKVEFWGKIFANKGNYYIAECPYQSNVPREFFGYGEKKEKTDDESLKEDAVDEENSESDDINEEEQSEENITDEEEETETDEEPKILPIPEPKLKKEIIIPPEEDGTGTNEYLYFVSIDIVGKWRCLPSLLPQHITAAKKIKRFFTGNLEREIGGGICFPGKEAHYLRAQIARISASTNIAPENFYTIQEDDDEEEEGEVEKLEKNEEYEAKSVKDIYSEGLEAWVHCRHAILNQGRCTPMKVEDEEEDEEDEEEEDDEGDNESKEDADSEIFEGAKEIEVPLLRSLSEDKTIGKLIPWTLKLTSKLIPEKAILMIHSNLWPGAYTYYDGKSFDRIYIGFGYKYSTYHYAPILSLKLQKEYPEPPIEPVDEEEEIVVKDSKEGAQEGDEELEDETESGDDTEASDEIEDTEDDDDDVEEDDEEEET